MSRPLRILLTNITLATRTGTELWIKEAALGLLRRGHAPMIYTPDPGVVAEEIRNATVPVVDDLSRLGVRPDVIHGHHHQPTLAALLQFPGVPALFVSHDWISWNDQPPRFPRILRYVAVDATNRDRLVVENAIPEDKVCVLLNWVDLERFRPRGPLPERPRRALVFSNGARSVTTLPAIQEACRRAGLELGVVGEGAGRLLERPEEVLGEYDLVFAKARAALEALAVGTAVVLCDVRGLGPLVTRADLDALRRLNLGARTLRDPVTPEGLLREIRRYDARDAAEVSRRVRETAGMEPALDQLLDLYGEVIAEGERLAPWDPVEEARAAAAYLSRWTTGAQRELRALRADRDRLQSEQNDQVRLREDLDRLQKDLSFLFGSATWRLREKLLRLPGVRSLYRGIRAIVRP
ncbi:MAG TPA: glycosyltransferase [Thermoanaerobaculia bacterium]|jgi:glycosyltransferase involved in cell wall biosynthesis|nr:glycosyltransferase [Thermoanaerobaculia bacterium]